MRPIRSRPRFGCDFCRYTATEATVARHEKICWRNPDRYCQTCNNTGVIPEDIDGYRRDYPCPYCETFNPEITPA